MLTFINFNIFFQGLNQKKLTVTSAQINHVTKSTSLKVVTSIMWIMNVVVASNLHVGYAIKSLAKKAL